MKTKFLFFATLFFLCFILSVKAQQHHRTIHLNIEGIRFDSMEVRLTVPGGGPNCKMTTIDHHLWKLQIPDSTFKSYFIADFYGYRLNQENKTDCHTIYFKSDTIKTPHINPASIFMDNLDSIPINLLYLNSTDRAGRNLISNFQMLEGTDPEIPRSTIFYDKYFEWGDGKTPYEEVIANYVQLVKTYPDSYALIKVVKMLVDWMEAKDMDKIYSCFSDRIKTSDQGIFIRNYIDRKLRFTTFENIQLPNWKTEKPEYIIQDTTKPCLVVFSASWCGPCHKMIPTLKEVYNEAKGKLNIVYVSIDRKNTIADWKKMMVDEAIPWGSVLTGYEKDNIGGKYFVSEIPCAYLVHPDGSFEKCDVRDEDSREKLRIEF